MRIIDMITEKCGNDFFIKEDEQISKYTRAIQKFKDDYIKPSLEEFNKDGFSIDFGIKPFSTYEKCDGSDYVMTGITFLCPNGGVKWYEAFSIIATRDDKRKGWEISFLKDNILWEDNLIEYVCKKSIESKEERINKLGDEIAFLKSLC